MRVNFKSRTVTVLILAAAISALLIFAINTTPRSTSAAAAPQSAASKVVLPQQSYADVVDRVSPAVVTIHAARRVRASQQFPFFDDPMFRQFFGNRIAPRRGMPPPKRRPPSGPA